MTLKIGKKFKYTLPKMLDKLIIDAMNFNYLREDYKDSKCFRCLALAFNGNKLIVLGQNKKKTHPFTKNYHDQHKMSIHAEADMVIQLLKKDLIHNVTDVIVIRGSYTPLSSRPCKLCQMLLNKYLKTTRIWWFNTDKEKWIVDLA